MFMSKVSGSRSGAISKALAVCNAVADGNFEARITGLDDHSAYKEMFLAINRMIDRADAYIRESQASLEYVAENKYFRRIQEKGMPGAFATASRAINAAAGSIEQRAEVFGGIVTQFDAAMTQSIGAVSSASGELEASAKSMDNTAVQTSEQATIVAAAAEQASTNVQTVASAAEELTASVGEISRQVAQSSEMAGNAVVEAKSVREQIDGLASASEKIGNVVELITGIAAQTNLLALNATIEAARAGDAGKGFAVVASEVKNLANQTAQATEEISGQILSIQTATTNTVRAIENIAATIDKMNQVTGSISTAVEEQGAASQEIATNVDQAAAGTTEVTKSIHLVSQGANDTGSAAGQILGAAGELAQQSTVLGREVAQFLEEVKKVI